MVVVEKSKDSINNDANRVKHTTTTQTFYSLGVDNVDSLSIEKHGAHCSKNGEQVSYLITIREHGKFSSRYSDISVNAVELDEVINMLTAMRDTKLNYK